MTVHLSRCIQVRQDIQLFTFAIEGHLTIFKPSADSYRLGRPVVQSRGRLSTAGKTPPAFLSGDCCCGKPKVKWFALERSPNVSYPIVSHGFSQIPAGYLLRLALSAVVARAQAGAKVLDRN